MSDLFKKLLFSDVHFTLPTETSKQRFLYADLARGFAVLFMVFVHCMEQYTLHIEQHSNVASFIINFLGSPPAAPVFMFLMGYFFIYSKKSDFKTGMIRGLKIMALGYLLNLCREVIPVSLGILKLPFEPIESFFTIDILPFAGLSLIFLTFLRFYLPYPFLWILLVIIIPFIAPYLYGISSDTIFLKRIFDLFFGTTEDYIFFPFFPWISYPLFGMIYGFFSLSYPDRNKLIHTFTIIGSVLVIVSSIFIINHREIHIGNYYRMNFGGTFWALGFVLVWLYLCELIVKYIPDNYGFHYIYFLSKNVTSFYFIQWLVISWATALYDYQSQHIEETILIIPMMLLVITILTVIYGKVKEIYVK